MLEPLHYPVIPFYLHLTLGKKGCIGSSADTWETKGHLPKSEWRMGTWGIDTFPLISVEIRSEGVNTPSLSACACWAYFSGFKGRLENPEAEAERHIAHLRPNTVSMSSSSFRCVQNVCSWNYRWVRRYVTWNKSACYTQGKREKLVQLTSQYCQTLLRGST